MRLVYVCVCVYLFLGSVNLNVTLLFLEAAAFTHRKPGTPAPLYLGIFTPGWRAPTNKLFRLSLRHPGLVSVGTEESKQPAATAHLFRFAVFSCLAHSQMRSWRKWVAGGW